ncbi:basement membrane-specific heparan sulfate proteoglycan core protein-like, partial [Mantella aurantiaca]
GNDITLVAYQTELRPREIKTLRSPSERANGSVRMGSRPTREHLMMALADLDEILIRASYSTDMLSASITGVSMETAGPSYTSLPQALEVEECRCPPGIKVCPASVRPASMVMPQPDTPEDCQPCACPLTDPENQFSKTCETMGTGGYRCTACPPGYTGQYCERCSPGFTGSPNIRGQKCLPEDQRSPFTVRIYPDKKTAAAGEVVTLRCQGSGDPPYYYFWSRADGRPLSSNSQLIDRGESLHFPSVQPSDSGIYMCTCRNYQFANISRAEIIVQASSHTRPITVTVEEQRAQSVRQGSDVTFICTAKSVSPAYTLVWTRQNNGKLPERAMDFNGILTIRNVQPEDAGIYICTGSNMFDMDEGNATLHVQGL